MLDNEKRLELANKRADMYKKLYEMESRHNNELTLRYRDMRRKFQKLRNKNCTLKALLVGVCAYAVIFTSLTFWKEYEYREDRTPAPIPIEENVTEPVPVELVAEKKDTLVSKGEFLLTAYCSCGKCCGKWASNRPKDEAGNDIVYTASGTVAKQGRTVAVDPKVIPYGTKIVVGDKEYIAEDTGKAIKGNRIDVYFNSHEEASQFGRKTEEVFVRSYV